MKGRRLTLVKLLIGITIVVAMGALVFSIASSAKERVNFNQCISNLRQIGVALRMYALDNDGFIPPYTNRLVIENYTDASGRELWIDTTPYINPSFLEGAFSSYTKDRRIWFCTQDPYAGGDALEGGIQHKFTSYEISFWIPLLSPILIDQPPSDTIPPWLEDPAYRRRFKLYLDLWREWESKVYAYDRHHELSDYIWFELRFDGSAMKRKVTTGPLPTKEELEEKGVIVRE